MRFLRIMTDNSHLFKKAMEGVKPQKPDDKISSSPKRKLKPREKQPAKQPKNVTLPSCSLSDHSDAELTPEQFVSFALSGVSHRYFKQLKQGKIPIEATLDLHGFTVDSARREFSQFIMQAKTGQLRCIHIIHGKGYRSYEQTGRLKTKVVAWLKQIPDILAFSSCLPKDGGTGAVYVLLRR